MTSKSPLKVFFTGNNKAGSWEIRGRQISDQRPYWKGSQKITEQEMDEYDVFVLVKRPKREVINKLKARNKTIIYDVIDAWGQPTDSERIQTKSQSMDFFRDKFTEFDVDSYIFSNKKMYMDLAPLVKHSHYIYHHFRPGLKNITVKEKPLKLGYEGSDRYLGHWKDTIQEIARKYGAEFVINPENFEDIDVGIAARDFPYNGYLEKNYKSNVKLANFYGSGIPCLVGADSCSYHETDCGDVLFFDDPEQFESQLQKLLPYEERLRIHNRFVDFQKYFTIDCQTFIFEKYFEHVHYLKQNGFLGKNDAAQAQYL